MVVFTCQHCGVSLQKNKVEKHYAFECKKVPFVTCVDCLKDYRGNEYVAHTNCMTEEQRYGGKDFVPKVSSNVKKRATWLTSVESSLNRPGLTKAQTDFIQTCLQYSNIPQKRKKFHNFVNSSFGRNKPGLKLTDIMFDLFEETHKQNLEQEKAENANIKVPNGDAEEAEKNNELEVSVEKKKSKVDKADVSMESSDQTVAKEKKKNKKDKKKRSIGESNESGILDGSSTHLNESRLSSASDMNNSNVDEAAAPMQVDDNQVEKKLSRKERKEKRKREKYEAELNEIENVNKENDSENKMNTDDGETNACHEDGVKKKKKNKRQVNDNCVENGCVYGKEISCKKKRRHEETVVDEPVQKKSKDSNIASERNESENASFNWDQLIIKVLECRSDKELSLNRLSKKIINEYYTVYGENHMTVEKLMSKFNKKIYKIPGVKVLKEKAKLVAC